MIPRNRNSVSPVYGGSATFALSTEVLSLELRYPAKVHLLAQISAPLSPNSANVQEYPHLWLESFF